MDSDVRNADSDVRYMASKNWPYPGHRFLMSGIWPYSAHHPGHIRDIAEGRAMGLDPIFFIERLSYLLWVEF